MARYLVSGDGAERTVRKLRERRPGDDSFVQRVRQMSEGRRWRVGALLAWMVGLRFDHLDAGERFRLLAVPMLFLGAVVIPLGLALLALSNVARGTTFDVVAGVVLGSYVVAGMMVLLGMGRSKRPR